MQKTSTGELSGVLHRVISHRDDCSAISLRRQLVYQADQLESALNEISGTFARAISLSRRRANSLLPFFKLPVELIEQIILLSITDSSCIGGIRLSRLYAAAAVCARLWCIIKGCPHFWTFIQLGTTASPRFFERSGARLALHIFWPSPNHLFPTVYPEISKGLMDRALLERSRIRSLTCDAKAFREWVTLIDTGCPSLKYLMVFNKVQEDTPTLSMKTGMLKLERLILCNVIIQEPLEQWLSLSSLKALTLAEIRQPLNYFAFFATLSYCRNLESLFLTRVQLGVLEDELDLPTADRVLLPALDFLSLISISTETAMVILRTLAAPELRQFQLRWRDDDQGPYSSGHPPMDLLEEIFHSEYQDSPAFACLLRVVKLQDAELLVTLNDQTDFNFHFDDGGSRFDVDLVGAAWLQIIPQLYNGLPALEGIPIRLSIINVLPGPRQNHIPEIYLLAALPSLVAFEIQDGDKDTVDGVIDYLSRVQYYPDGWIYSWPCPRLTSIQITTCPDAAEAFYAEETLQKVQAMALRRTTGYSEIKIMETRSGPIEINQMALPASPINGTVYSLPIGDPTTSGQIREGKTGDGN